MLWEFVQALIVHKHPIAYLCCNTSLKTLVRTIRFFDKQIKNLIYLTNGIGVWHRITIALDVFYSNFGPLLFLFVESYMAEEGVFGDSNSNATA